MSSGAGKGPPTPTFVFCPCPSAQHRPMCRRCRIRTHQDGRRDHAGLLGDWRWNARQGVGLTPSTLGGTVRRLHWGPQASPPQRSAVRCSHLLCSLRGCLKGRGLRSGQVLGLTGPPPTPQSGSPSPALAEHRGMKMLTQGAACSFQWACSLEALPPSSPESNGVTEFLYLALSLLCLQWFCNGATDFQRLPK